MRRLLTIVSMVFSFSAWAQAPTQPPLPRTSVGFGMGLDYGGFGGKIEFRPIHHLSVFMGLGYNLVDVGFNGGLSYKILPHKMVNPIVNLMYGYNTVILTDYSPKKTLYGPSVGAGCEFRVSKNRYHFIHAGLNVPFRGKDFEGEASPVLFSLGFNFR